MTIKNHDYFLNKLYFKVVLSSLTAHYTKYQKLETFLLKDRTQESFLLLSISIELISTSLRNMITFLLHGSLKDV